MVIVHVVTEQAVVQPLCVSVCRLQEAGMQVQCEACVNSKLEEALTSVHRHLSPSHIHVQRIACPPPHVCDVEKIDMVHTT